MDSISFIIPIYNVNVGNLKKCIDSITKQNFNNYEILLINDGSSDLEIEKKCKEFQKENSRIKYFYEDNSGSAVARNKGLDEAEKEYIVFVDADDMLTDNYRELLNTIHDKNFEFIILDYCYWNQNEEKIFSFSEENDFINKKNDILANIMFYPEKMNNFMFGSIWAKVFSKKFLNKNDIRFIPELRKAQDRRFMLEVIYKSKRILYYPIFAYKYRANEKSITHKINYKMIDYYYFLYKEMEKFCVIYNIEGYCSKFLQYNIVNELVLLTVFHINNKKHYREIKKEYKQIYQQFKLKESLTNIKIKDIPSTKGKIKLFLYKMNWIYLLNKLFRIQQRKKNKNNFKN